MQSNFQRSFSRVWFGSQQQQHHSIYDNFNSLPTYYNANHQNPLQSITEESFSSPKNESGDERKRSFLIWGNRQSPSNHSHKSQDSGFSDTETSPNNNQQPSRSHNTSNTSSQSNQSSPSASSRIATPPTVIRRPEKVHIYEEIKSARRISFSAPSSPSPKKCDEITEINQELQSQLSEINFNSTSPMNANDSARSSCRSCKIKRSRVITKNSQQRLKASSNNSSFNESYDSNNNNCNSYDEIDQHQRYNNETVYFGYGENDEVMEEKSLLFSPIRRVTTIFPSETSTPKSKQKNCNGILESLTDLLPQPIVYKNELLNGNFASVQNWIDSLQFNVASEVLSTLQSKSIEADNFVLTPTYAYKLIKSIQSKAILIQQQFETIEKNSNRGEFLPCVQHLADAMLDFIGRQEMRKMYFAHNGKQYKKLCENFQSLREMLCDLKNICTKIDVDDLDEFPICDDMQLIKRYFLITMKILFKILVSAIVDCIEHAHNEIMLRSNITHVANLISTSNDYEGTFSSLSDAFTENSVVRVLLLVCLENKNSWMRALSLRTLALVCVNEDTIQQFEINSGFEILRDIIVDKSSERLEQEIRESVSLLASITAPWQQTSASEDPFKELKLYAEDYIEGITSLLDTTKSPQTILICVAVLNNLSRLESTSIYSLISHQTLTTLTRVFAEQVGGEYTIFFVEQITAVILNMSQNRKSHYHLTSKHILNFIFDIFLTIHHLEYDNHSQMKAKRKSTKNILNTLKNLELTSTSHEINESIRSIITKIHRKLFEMDFGETTAESFNISRNSKNVTKISIYSQETFL